MESSQQDQREKNPEEEPPASRGPALRILCLHDANSNATELHEHIKELDKRLWEKHGMELVYVNSPLVVVKDQEQDANNTRDNQPIRVWWQKSGEHEFLGLDASLLHLQQIYKSTPFIGIMAFGQGAQIGSILPPLLHPVLEFGIFVRGRSIMEEDVMMMEGWPCLHITKSDAVDESSQRLLRQYPGQVHSSSNKSDSLLLPEFNAIGKFVIQQKKRLASSDTTCIVLQTQLHLLEQEASRLIAEQIAEDPPRALIAVIQPQSVGGWNRKRREFGAEGGGAPCPSDFLLRREKRVADSSGPSRHHPSANREENHDLQSVDDLGERQVSAS
jgi:hypothetical protein